jgi:hypothetical protein
MARRATEPAASPVRGAILVVVAIAVGVFLLRNGLDTDVAVTADDASPETTAPSSDDGDGDGGGGDGGDGGDGGATDDTETTRTTVAVRPPAEVRVIVLNGSSVTGAAGTWSDGLQANGYDMLEAGNANASVEITQVLHQGGFRQEAASVVEALGAPAGVSPQRLGSAPPGEIGDANVVVVIGPDLASGQPPAPGGGTPG